MSRAPRALSLPLILLCAALPAACGGGTAKAHPQTPPPATTPTTPANAADPAATYKIAADTLNAAVATGRTRLTADAGEWSALKADFQELADAYRRFDAAVKPLAASKVSVSTYVRQLLQADNNLELYLQAAAYAPNPDELRTDEQQAAAAARARSGWSDAIRQGLRLPPEPST